MVTSVNIPPESNPFLTFVYACVQSMDNHLLAACRLWAEKAPAGNGEFRDMAVTRIENCLRRQANLLDLSHLHLTELPPYLPHHVKILLISDNDLSQIASTSLPPELENLNACGNPKITAIPPDLPPTLTTLNVCHCNIEIIQDDLPPNLQKLLISHNRRLTSLPDLLPNCLQWLIATSCCLTRLPERFPPFLCLLDVQDNALGEVPQTITDLSPDTCVQLLHNPLFESTRQRLARLVSQHNYHGPYLA